ncbi:MAG: hypothetical protein JSR74_17185 [Proteobacteria bacterium]|nr:hypothetical protein [Pseudomonadota bacterium]
MTPHPAISPKNVCESLLNEEKRYNAEHHILPSESAVVDRLLNRGLEMTPAYEELHSKLHQHPQALRTFLGLVLTAAAFWNPEEIAEARNARNDLTKVNQKIARQAAELAELLQQRSDLGNTSGFRTDTHYHVCDVIQASSQRNYGFKHYVREHLDGLQRQFDLKYWPTLSDFTHELARDAAAAVAQASDPLTAATTAASKASLADFVKALFASIEENSARNYGHLPHGLQISDSTFAILVNCALDLDADSMVDGPYVKRLRQREREGAK